ncbi:hypothetical protein KEM48_009884 [Puccinia striiformis f. sp. tritici PST-130]|nr:hypothetical protein KEM48_009884 [Puccinia striiformis f. sp. tritici PST-130]
MSSQSTVTQQSYTNNGVTHYLARWEGYGPQNNTWELEAQSLPGAIEILDQYRSVNSSELILR